MTDKDIFTQKLVMQGHCNSALHFQNMMERCLQDHLYQCLIVRIDDLLLFAKNVDDYLLYLDNVFVTMNRNGFKLNPAKSTLFALSVKWCGHLIAADGNKQDVSRIQALLDIPEPQNAGEVQQFLCSVEWMPTAIPDYARKAKNARQIRASSYWQYKKERRNPFTC
jgi:hypothetical protein